VSVLDLARPALRALTPYQPGAYEADTIRMNANESPYRLASDTTERGLNIYPPPRPTCLREALAQHYGVRAEQALVTRGSSEAIDILIRGFCEANRDGILICPPTFDMYRVYATIQGAQIHRVPLLAEQEFRLNTDAVLSAIHPSIKLVFLCSPNNPTGRAVARADIDRLCTGLAERCVLVIDEAYYEFSSERHCLDLLERFEHVVILRTLSKFVSLAGARCGTVLAVPAVISFLEGILPPYTFPTPSIELVSAALDEVSLTMARERVALIRRERIRLAASLADLPAVAKVFPSDANFLLVQVRNRDSVMDAARRAGILLRAFDGDPILRNCIRITVGRPEDNDALLKAIGKKERSFEP
jgi:histidinol-phosphate aminotransferase